MSAQPVHDPDPCDPLEILRVLPEAYHAQFRAEYTAAAEHAWRGPEGYRKLREELNWWRLRAIAYSSPGYEEDRERARAGAGPSVPIADLVPDWDDLVAAARRHRQAG